MCARQSVEALGGQYHAFKRVGWLPALTSWICASQVVPLWRWYCRVFNGNTFQPTKWHLFVTHSSIADSGVEEKVMVRAPVTTSSFGRDIKRLNHHVVLLAMAGKSLCF